MSYLWLLLFFPPVLYVLIGAIIYFQNRLIGRRIPMTELPHELGHAMMSAYDGAVLRLDFLPAQDRRIEFRKRITANGDKRFLLIVKGGASDPNEQQRIEAVLAGWSKT